MRRQIDILSTIDWLSVFLYLLLIIFGWLNVFAVNYTAADGSFFSLSHRYTMQMAWMILSMVVILFIFAIDSRFFSFMAYPAYALSMLMLLSVVVIGTAVHGSKSWIVLGPVSLQPSEFAKLATILALARYLSGYNMKITRPHDVLIAVGITFFPALLIMLQPDFGSTLVYVALVLVLYREGLPGMILVFLLSVAGLFLITLLLSPFVLLIVLSSLALLIYVIVNRKPLHFVLVSLAAACLILIVTMIARYGIIPGNKLAVAYYTLGGLVVGSLVLGIRTKSRIIISTVLVLVVAVGFTYSVDYVFHNVMKEHQQNRVNVMLGLESDPYGYEYNVRQSKIAIGSGGFVGKGFMQGTQTKFRFVPEQSTDFIFCTVGEEWGFLGSFGLVLLYVGLLLRLIVLAERQRSKFSRIYGYGVVAVLFFHFAVNLGMTIGLFPVIGIPLPFLSYGGSSFLTFSVMLFIFIRLDASRKTYLI